jgi:hypothetical protein
MAAAKVSIKVPPLLFDAIQLRWPRLKYQSLSSYFIGLARYDCMVQGTHATTLPIAQSRPEERDRVDAELLELSKTGVGVRGEFLVRLLERMASGELDTKEKIAEALVAILAKAHSK